jgi:RES domain-containing protein
MRVYRVASSRYPLDSSDGSRRKGGRWNRAGTPVIYASATKSLGFWEVWVHAGAIPQDYHVIEIDIPDGVEISDYAAVGSKLPDGWRSQEELTRAIGDLWVSSNASVALKVPSAVIAGEYNYILNPAHPDFRKLQFSVAPEPIDSRMKPAKS